MIRRCARRQDLVIWLPGMWPIGSAGNSSSLMDLIIVRSAIPFSSDLRIGGCLLISPRFGKPQTQVAAVEAEQIKMRKQICEGVGNHTQIGRYSFGSGCDVPRWFARMAIESNDRRGDFEIDRHLKVRNQGAQPIFSRKS
jgi:hypothetical protein